MAAGNGRRNIPYSSTEKWRPLAGQDSQFGIRGLGSPGTFMSVHAWATGGAFAPFDGTSALTDAALSDVTRLTA